MSDPIGQPASTTESLAGWAAPYVTGMLAKGEALSNQPYQAYGGPLTAGQSESTNSSIPRTCGAYRAYCSRWGALPLLALLPAQRLRTTCPPL
jgi:hypothetical protein